MKIPLTKLEEARALLKPYFTPTPVIKAAIGPGPTDHALVLKVETGLPTGSFKVRRAVYPLPVNARTPAITAIAASTGNHGDAAAYAGRLLGIPAMIFIPDNPNQCSSAHVALQPGFVHRLPACTRLFAPT